MQTIDRPFRDIRDPIRGNSVGIWWVTVLTDIGSAVIADGKLVASEQFDMYTTLTNSALGRHAFMEVAVDPGQYAGIYYVKDDTWTDYIGIDVYGDGTIEAYDSAVGEALWSTTYDPIAHRYVGFEEVDGTFYIRVSANGTTWTTVWSGAAPAWLSSCGLWIGGEPLGSPGEGDVVTLFGVNYAMATSPMVECFGGSALDPDTWPVVDGYGYLFGQGSTVVADGALTFTITGLDNVTLGASRGIVSSGYDMVPGDSFTIELAPDAANNWLNATGFAFYLSSFGQGGAGHPSLEFRKDDSLGLQVLLLGDPSWSSIDWVTNRFWKIEYAGGPNNTYNAYYSPDGVTWTLAKTKDIPFSHGEPPHTVELYFHHSVSSEEDEGPVSISISINGINCTAGKPLARFYPSIRGTYTTLLTDQSVPAEGTTIESYFYRYWKDGSPETVLGTSTAKHPLFTVPDAGTYVFEQTVWDSLSQSSTTTRTVSFGPGFTAGPYNLPTTKYAGEFLIELDPLIDWSGVSGVIIASDGSAWLDYMRLPKPGGGVECRVIGRTISDGPDQPVRSLEATLVLNTETGSLSPDVFDSPWNNLSGKYSPAIFGRRRIIVQQRISGDPGSTDPDDYRPRFWGRIDDCPASSSGVLSIFARDLASDLMIPYSQDPIQIGAVGGLVNLATAIQAILDNLTSPGQWVVKVVGADAEWGVPSFVMGQVEDGLQFIRDLVQQRGLVARWWYDTDTARFQFLVFQLQEDKDSPDFIYDLNETESVPKHGSDLSTYRNDFTLFYRPAGSSTPVRVTRPATDDEIRSFGFHPVVIRESSTSLIDSEDEAERMLDSLETLRYPATVGRRRLIPRNEEIEINTLLRFVADGRLADTAVDLYVTDWTERWAIQGERVEDYIEVELRNAPTGQLRAWLDSIRAQDTGQTQQPPQLPLVEYKVKATTDTGTLWWRIQELGIPVIATESQTKEPNGTWSGFGAPTRGPGQPSVVKGGFLGQHEYETDVPLTEDLVSYIEARYTILGGQIETITIQPIDADAYPKILSAVVQALQVIVQGDDDVLSIEIEKTSGGGSAYDDATDGNSASFNVPVPDGDTWVLEVRGYNTTIANRGDPGELVHTVVVIVANELDENSTYPSAYPTLSSFTVAKPAVGDYLMELGIQVANPQAGYTLRVEASFIARTREVRFAGDAIVASWINEHTIPFTTVNDQLGPALVGLPSSLTTFYLPTRFPRAADPSGGEFAWEDGDRVVSADVRVSVINPQGHVVVPPQMGVTWKTVTWKSTTSNWWEEL